MPDDTSSIQNGPGGDPGVVSIVGENVRRLRERAGFSLRELATRAGVSPSTLSNLEGGLGNPGVETLVDISRALNVAFSELVTPHEPDVRVQRSDEGVVTRASGAPFTNRLLVTAGGRSLTEIYEATMEPSGLYRAEPHLAGVTESVILMHGRMATGPDGAAIELGPGDRATFAGDQFHTYQALEIGTRAIIVLTYR